MESYVPAKLAYKVFEPSAGADEKLSPIIFLHGVTGSKENWCDIPQLVADGTKRRAYAVDSRNHGYSEYCKVFNFKANVDDLFNFMDTIKAPSATIVGHSMGGITAIRAALRKPERIDMIVVEDMYTKKIGREGCQYLLEALRMRVALIQSIPAHLTDSEAVKFFIDTVLSHVPENELPFTKTPDLYNMKISFVRREDGGLDVKYDKERIFKAIEDSDNLMDDPKGQYLGPAHFIYGGRSTVSVGTEKEHIKQYFPNVEFTEFENATHYLHMEYPKEFAHRVIQICNKL